MMRWIVDSGLKVRRLVVAVAVGVLVLGVVQVTRTSVDLLPEFAPTRVEVQTEALGLSANEVEQLITVPLEQDLLVGVPFLDEMESVSLPGLSSVVMTFEPGTDLLDARQVVQERLTQAAGVAGLPDVAKPPQMIQPVSSTGRVSMLKLTSQELTPIEMSVLARWVIGPRLLGVAGISNIAIWGNRDRQLQVLVDPERLRQADVTLSQVIRTTGNALEVSPLSYLEASQPGTGGFLDTPNQRLNIFHEQTIRTPEELAQVPVDGAGDGPGSIILGDISEVVEDHQLLTGDAVCAGGEQCLLMVLEKFPNADTAATAAGVEQAVTALRPGLADMQIDSSVYRPATYVESSMTNLAWVLLIAGILLILLVVGFVWEWRRSVLVLGTTAVSAATAVVVLQYTGASVNLLVVAGLVLGLTVMIDDAVNDVDSLAVRMRQHRERDTGHPVWEAIVEAASAMRGSLFFGSLIVAAAVVPLFFLTGEGASFLPPIALAYLLAVASSLVVALLLTPALGMLLLAKAPLTGGRAPVVRWLHQRYDGMAPRAFARTGLALGLLAGFALVGVAAVPFLESSMKPSLKEHHVVVNMTAPAGTSLPKMTGIANQAVQSVSGLAGVEDVTAQVGRAAMSDQIVDVNRGELWVALDPEADHDATVAAVEDAVAGLPEVTTDVMTYSDEQVSEILESDDRDVVVRVYGEDQTVLNEKAEEIRAAMAGIDGITELEVPAIPTEETVEVEVDLARAQAVGMKPGDVRRAAAILLGGITVGNLFEEQKVFDVVVWGTPELRDSIEDVQSLLIQAPNGRTVRLGDIAEVRSVPNEAIIRHESVTRYVEVAANVTGRNVTDVNTEVETMIGGISFPLDHHAELKPGFVERQADFTQLMAITVATLFAIYLLLQAAFRSWRLAALAYPLLAVSLSGGLVAILLTGRELSLGSVAGLLAVLGLASRGLVVLFRHLQNLQWRQGQQFGEELVVRGARDRVAPTVLGVLAMVVVLLPVLVFGRTAGLEVLHPAAIALLGGLVTTTIVNLFVAPALYLRYGSTPDPDLWADELLEETSSPAPVAS